jgi:putative phage-type endonuclease
MGKGQLVPQAQDGGKPTVLKNVDGQYAVEVTGQNLALVTFSNGTSITVDTAQLGQRHDMELWLAVRASLELTASEFSSVLGKSVFTKRETLLLRKLGRDPNPFTGNAATAWGLRCEPIAVAEYVTVSGCTVEETGLHVHATDLGLGASPDGLVFDPTREAEGLDPHGLLEVKCLFGRRNKKEIGTFDHCPKRFYDQIQGQLEVCDREFCDLFVWIPRNSKRPNAQRVRVLRNREYWADIMAPAIAAFREDVRTAQSSGAEERAVCVAA